MLGDPPWSESRDGLVVAVRLTPKGARDALEGVRALSDGRAVLSARVRAAPESGKANEALLRLIAASAGVARSQVSLSSGATSRLKTIRVIGDSEALARALEAACMPKR